MDEDLLDTGEAVLAALREHEAVVHRHLELAAAAGLEFGLDAPVLTNLGRQTGGPWEVVSLHAVADDDPHGDLRR